MSALVPLLIWDPSLTVLASLKVKLFPAHPLRMTIITITINMGTDQQRYKSGHKMITIWLDTL